MRLIRLLSFRYLFSKKSNNIINIISWISVLAISFTTAAFIIIVSVMNGFTSVVSNLYNSIEPDLKILPAQGKYFNPDSIFSILSKKQGIASISKTISNQALIKYRQNQILITVRGVDSVFGKTTNVQSVLRKGKFYFKDKNINYCVVGQGVATELNINIENQFIPILFYSPKRIKNTGTSTDIINEKSAYVSGIFSINDDFDYKFVFTDLHFAQELFDAEGLVSSIDISIHKSASRDKIQQELQSQLGNKFVVKNKDQLNEVLFKTLETEKLWTFIIMSFILLIATFSIISALTMLIIEKQKDIQTLYALGAHKRMIESIFMVEGFLITFGGAFVGLLLGVIICWIQIQFHIITFNENSILPYYPVEVKWEDLALVLSVLLIIGFIAALYPVRLFTKEVKWNK